MLGLMVFFSTRVYILIKTYKGITLEEHNFSKYVYTSACVGIGIKPTMQALPFSNWIKTSKS